MKINVEGSPKEIAELFQAIESSKEQNKVAKTCDYPSLSEKHRSN